MAFDPCSHQITQIVINAAKLIRNLKGLPEERNLTVLYREAATLLGVPAEIEKGMNSIVANHLPAPHEMKGDDGKPFIPRTDCPKCNRKESVILISLCPSCKDSENGTYHSARKCEAPGCDYIDKSKEFFIQRLKREYPDISLPTGTKKEMGVKTLTDKGLE